MNQGLTKSRTLTVEALDFMTPLDAIRAIAHNSFRVIEHSGAPQEVLNHNMLAQQLFEKFADELEAHLNEKQNSAR